VDDKYMYLRQRYPTKTQNDSTKAVLVLCLRGPQRPLNSMVIVIMLRDPDKRKHFSRLVTTPTPGERINDSNVM